LNSSSKGSQKTVNILNNKIQVNIELVKGEKKKLVRYDGSYRNEYTFISPLTGKRWWITPKGYSSHFKSEHWNANWVDGSHGTYQNITRNCGTYGHSMKGAIVKAIESECGYGSLESKLAKCFEYMCKGLPFEVIA